jgi:hypothetical protein
MSNADDVAAIPAFLDGTASDSDLLGRPVSSEFERCRRRYAIGWQRLGGGHRAAAAAAFRDVYGTTAYGALARCILIRMTDLDWPRAIAKR